jgi:hypothetical protein
MIPADINGPRMPIQFTYDTALKMLFTTADGLISFADIQSHREQESGQQALGHRELFDATSAWTNLTSEQVKLLVKTVHSKMQSGPFGPAAVVTVNDKLFGMVSMLAILADLEGGPPIAAFRAFDEALDWLVGH